jgi:MSHA biogenesis protein MshJ
VNALRTLWNQWNGKFAALTRRERGIIAAAIILGGSLLLHTLAVEPLQLKARLATKAIGRAQTDLEQQQAQLLLLKTGRADPDAANRQRLAQLEQRLAKVDAQLAEFEAGMVPPSQMRGFLGDLLARNGHVELLGLQTLPAVQVGDLSPAKPADGAQPARDATAGEGIYRHGVELRLAGSYNALLDYLADIERMPQRLMWDSVRLTVKKYPRNELVLRIYTLSLDHHWLTV